MAEFKKRSVVATIRIEGEEFTTDFGRDVLSYLPKTVLSKVNKLEAEHTDIEDEDERYEKILQEEKAVFKDAINILLDDETASDRLFAEDDSSLFLSDVYTYIIEEYTALMQKQPKKKGGAKN